MGRDRGCLISSEGLSTFPCRTGHWNTGSTSVGDQDEPFPNSNIAKGFIGLVCKKADFWVSFPTHHLLMHRKMWKRVSMWWVRNETQKLTLSQTAPLTRVVLSQPHIHSDNSKDTNDQQDLKSRFCWQKCSQNKLHCSILAPYHDSVPQNQQPLRSESPQDLDLRKQPKASCSRGQQNAHT